MKKNILATMAIAFWSVQGMQAQQLTGAHARTLQNAAQGSVIELPGLLTEEFQVIGIDKMVLPGPQFIISDDPEYIREPEAIALQEPIQPGAVRLYVYNVNGVEKPKKIPRKITALLKNTGSEPMHFKMIKYSSQKPSGNYFQIGKQGLYDYFTSTESHDIITVAPGEAVPIDPKFETEEVVYNDLVHGFYEFVVDQPGEVTILQTDPDTPGPEALKTIDRIIPTSGVNAGRGVFGVSNYKVSNEEVLDTKDGIQQIVVADGDLDPWVEGIENHSGEKAYLAGNYGVIYDIELKWKSTDGKGLALITWNARSGDNQWCSGMAASMVVSDGKFPGGVVQLPADQLVTKGKPEAILIQVFKPEEGKEEQTLRVKYSPPGASCLPTPLIFVPVDLP